MSDELHAIEGREKLLTMSIYLYSYQSIYYYSKKQAPTRVDEIRKEGDSVANDLIHDWL